MTPVIVEHAAYAITAAVADLKQEVARSQTLDEALRVRETVRGLVKELEAVETAACNWTNAFRGER